MSHDLLFAEYLYDRLVFVDGLNCQNIACRVLNPFCILPKGACRDQKTLRDVLVVINTSTSAGSLMVEAGSLPKQQDVIQEVKACTEKLCRGDHRKQHLTKALFSPPK